MVDYYKIFTLALLVTQCRAVPVRKTVDKEDNLATDFFEEFNSLFGYDWWGKDKDSVSSTTTELPPSGRIGKQDARTDIDALMEELQLTERHSSGNEILTSSTFNENEDIVVSTKSPNENEDQIPGLAISMNSNLDLSQTPVLNENPEPKREQVSRAFEQSAWQAQTVQTQPLSSHHQQPANAVPYLPYQHPPPQGHGNYPYQHPAQNPYQHPAQNPYVYPAAYVQTPYGIQPIHPSVHAPVSSTEQGTKYAPVTDNVKTEFLQPPPSLLPFPFYYLPYPFHPHPQVPSKGAEGDSSLATFMSQSPIAPTSGQHEGSSQIMGPWNMPRMFLDPSMNTFMALGAPAQTVKDEEDVPSARTYGSVDEEEKITLQTMLDEKKAADAKSRENSQESNENSSTIPPPLEARMTGKIRSRDALNLVRTPLDYSSLASSKTTPQPLVEAVKELLADEEEILDDSADVPEVDETTICQTEEGLIGSCNTPTECAMVSGLPSGSCTVPSVSGNLQCCLHTASCGQKSAQLVTYINNELYPATTNSVSSCPISIALLPDICQVRLDFLHFSFKPPVGGTCDLANAISLSTTPGGVIAQQPLCGHIAETGDHLSSSVPHLYAHYNLSHSPLPYHYHQLNVHIAVKDFPSTWNIRVAQIRCDVNPSKLTPLMATTSCSQWYTSPSATMDSVILLSGSKNQFRACIKPDQEACGIRYKIYSAVCNKQDKIQIMGSNISTCGAGKEEREVVLPATDTMGVVVTPGKEQVNKLRGCLETKFNVSLFRMEEQAVTLWDIPCCTTVQILRLIR